MGHLETIRQMVESELKARKFLYLPESQDRYFEKDQLFGEDVYQAFPDAREDLTAAGTAFAMELYTASVVYLMRVAEYGLRKLARRMKIKIIDKATLIPLEYADWGKVVTAIQNEIVSVRKLPHGPKRQRRLEIYSDAADHCDYMKDIWRNTTAHARKSYIESEALATMDRVQAFMQFLSANL